MCFNANFVGLLELANWFVKVTVSVGSGTCVFSQHYPIVESLALLAGCFCNEVQITWQDILLSCNSF